MSTTLIVSITEMIKKVRPHYWKCQAVLLNPHYTEQILSHDASATIQLWPFWTHYPEEMPISDIHWHGSNLTCCCVQTTCGLPKATQMFFWFSAFQSLPVSVTTYIFFEFESDKRQRSFPPNKDARLKGHLYISWCLKPAVTKLRDLYSALLSNGSILTVRRGT